MLGIPFYNEDLLGLGQWCPWCRGWKWPGVHHGVKCWLPWARESQPGLCLTSSCASWGFIWQAQDALTKGIRVEDISRFLFISEHHVQHVLSFQFLKFPNFPDNTHIRLFQPSNSPAKYVRNVVLLQFYRGSRTCYRRRLPGACLPSSGGTQFSTGVGGCLGLLD